MTDNWDRGKRVRAMRQSLYCDCHQHRHTTHLLFHMYIHSNAQTHTHTLRVNFFFERKKRPEEFMNIHRNARKVAAGTADRTHNRFVYLFIFLFFSSSSSSTCCCCCRRIAAVASVSFCFFCSSGLLAFDTFIVETLNAIIKIPFDFVTNGKCTNECVRT